MKAYLKTGAVLLGGIALVAALSFLVPAPCANGCNVILIMMDTLSARHIAAYGYGRDTLPQTTAFFEKGVIFENAQSNAPWTLPSFNSMYHSDLATNITYADLESDARPTLQSVLRGNGVTLRAVVPGLDNFIFDAITRKFRSEELRVIAGKAPFIVAEQELPALIEGGEPFFFLVHSFEAHDPFEPHPPFNSYYGKTDGYPTVTRKDMLAEFDGRIPDQETVDIFELRYDQQIAQTDERIARFLNAIPPSALLNTVVILSSDHGEAFNEHGYLFHANSLFEEELHVPLMMRVPGVAHVRVKEPVSLMDLAPTILSFMQAPTPDGFRGDDLAPLISGETLGPRAIPFVQGKPFYFGGEMPSRVFASIEDAGALGADTPIIGMNSYGVRIGSQKAFKQDHPPLNAGLHWYDLSEDPGETKNLAESAPLPQALIDALESYSLPSIR